MPARSKGNGGLADAATFRAWPPWASLLALLPLVVAAKTTIPIALLPAAAILAALPLLLVRRGLGARAAAVDAAALVVAGGFAAYATAVGTQPPIDLPALLAVSLPLGTAALAWSVQENRGHPPATDRCSRRLARLATLRFDRALAVAVVIVGINLAKCVWAFGKPALAYAWLVSCQSWMPLLLGSAVCLVPGGLGNVASGAALLAVEAAAVWDFASTEVYLTLDQPLTWPDVRVRLSDPAGPRILAEGLLSWRALGLTLWVVVGFLLLSRGLRRLTPAANFWALSRVLLLIYASGGVLVGGRLVLEKGLAERHIEAASAPWSAVHADPDYAQTLDLAAAREARASVDEPFWEDGPAPLLAKLLGRYPGRSVVLVMLESHRASDVAGLGEGARDHRASSPRLSELARDGLLFTNYYQPHRPTYWALWTMLSGLPYAGPAKPTYSGPQAAALGRMPDFAALGYQCQWMCPTSTQFDNWRGLMQSAGVRFWIDTAEAAGLSKEYWTAWGMPDDQLMDIALRRFLKATATGRPLFLGVLTVSNHPPFRFPPQLDGAVLGSHLQGGMRFADHALGKLIDALRRLPEPQRPIVFVTADTATGAGMRFVEPMGISNLEGLRIPGLLLLPDREVAGLRYEGLFSHEDTLDLLYGLVARPVTLTKFRLRHRTVVSSTDLLLTARTYFDPHEDRFFDIVSRWKLVASPAPADETRLRAAWERQQALARRLWRPETKAAAAGQRGPEAGR